MHCPYCEANANKYPELEDDFGRMMCAECFVAGFGNCGCQNNRPDDRPHQMPDEIVAWPADVTPPGETALTGTWSARRHYTDEAVTYVRKDKTQKPRKAEL